MKTIFGFSRNAVALVGIIAAIILVVLIGLIIIGSAAIRGLMAPGLKVEGVSLLALLVTIIVLLTAVFIMLLVLFWCCCRKTRTGKEGELPPNVAAALLPFLPLLPQIRTAMSDTAVALYASGETLQWIQGKFTNAATFVQNVANDAAGAAQIKVKRWNGGGNPPGFVDAEFNPLNDLTGNLREAAKRLNPDLDQNMPGRFPLTLEGATLDVNQVGQRMKDAARGLAVMAKALGANPPDDLTT